MATLSMLEVARLVVARGFVNPAVAVAVCFAESGGNTLATNVVHNPSSRADNSRDRGLWQINSYWHAEVSDVCAYNAACNADATYRISIGGRSWTPWTTYNHRSHERFMMAAQTAINQATLPPPPPIVYDPPTHQYGLWPLGNKPVLTWLYGWGDPVKQAPCLYFNHVAIYEAAQYIQYPRELFTESSIRVVQNMNAFFNADGHNAALAEEARRHICGPEAWKIIDMMATRKR